MDNHDWMTAATLRGDFRTMHVYVGDGNKDRQFEFNFQGGYIDRRDIKAFMVDAVTYEKIVLEPQFVNTNTIKFERAVPAGWKVTVYRDTPKGVPIVEFMDGAIINAINLETATKQAVFSVAELFDRFDSVTLSQDEAITMAAQAKIAASNAANDAHTASDKAVQAGKDADDARKSASSASASAARAEQTADAAKRTAEGIDGKATQAQKDASDAVQTANAAKNTADGVNAKAEQAQRDAQDAQGKSSNALSTADAAKSKADAAINRANEVNDGIKDLGRHDQLDQAKVGDAGKVRSNIGCLEAATLHAYPEANGSLMQNWHDCAATGRQVYQMFSKYGWGSYHGNTAPDLMQSLPSGLYAYSPGNKNAPYNGYGQALVMHNDGDDWRVILHFPAGGNTPLYSCFTNDAWNRWQLKFVIQGINAWIDGNGNWKSSSPIYKLCDTAKLVEVGEDFTVSGYGASNPEAEGVHAERIGKGVYRITGSKGFATEGWYIGVPKDKNDQPLIWVDYDNGWNEGGDFIIRTYHRTYKDVPPFAQNNIKGYKDGDPIDIPEGRQVDLRLNMV